MNELNELNEWTEWMNWMNELNEWTEQMNEGIKFPRIHQDCGKYFSKELFTRSTKSVNF